MLADQETGHVTPEEVNSVYLIINIPHQVLIQIVTHIVQWLSNCDWLTCVSNRSWVGTKLVITVLSILSGIWVSASSQVFISTCSRCTTMIMR